jgi:hypothetical protein
MEDENRTDTDVLYRDSIGRIPSAGRPVAFPGRRASGTMPPAGGPRVWALRVPVYASGGTALARGLCFRIPEPITARNGARIT